MRCLNVLIRVLSGLVEELDSGLRGTSRERRGEQDSLWLLLEYSWRSIQV